MCSLHCVEHIECVEERFLYEDVLSERYENGELYSGLGQCKEQLLHPRCSTLVVSGTVNELWLRISGYSLEEVECAFDSRSESDLEVRSFVKDYGWYISCRGELVSTSANGRKSEWHQVRGEDGLVCPRCMQSRNNRGSKLRYIVK
jgi:hypothetical protein